MFDDDEDLEITDETLKNNISRLSHIESDELETDQLEDNDSKRDVTNEEGNDEGKCDATDLFNRDLKVPFHTSDGSYRVDHTPGVHDP